MIERNLKEVEDLVFHTDERWKDRKYIASLRLKSLAVELFDLFLINSVRIIPDCPFDEPFDVVGKNGPYIFSLWHGSLFGCLYFYRQKNIAVMASLSKDGDLITKVLDSLGYQKVRGSSSRGGARVLLEAIKKIKAGTTVAFTVDGPKGPRHEIKPGIIKLAQKTGIPIVPLCVSYSNSITISSWDKLQIPLPFSRAVLHIGKPLKIDTSISMEDGCKILKDYMFKCEELAAKKLKAL